jgi:hypothetical protein
MHLAAAEGWSALTYHLPSGGIGRRAFLASGLRSVISRAPSVTIGSEAFMGCPALATASFGQVFLGDFAFCGCARLSRLVVEQIVSWNPFGLSASGVSEVSSARASTLPVSAHNVMTRPRGMSFTVEWSESKGRGRIVAMTSLTIRGGPCPIEAAERRLLAKVDLSALDELPRGLTLHDCYFLEQVRLPLGLAVIPARMFDSCLRLTHVNLGECSGLRVIAEGSFRSCWMLEVLDVPERCESV